MKQRPPAFQFYIKQWLGDDKVTYMDDDAQGLHLRLMCMSWQASPPCSIPNDEFTLRQLLKTCSNNKKWNRVWPQIKRAWKTVKKTPDILIQSGLLRAYKKQREFSKKQSQNAKRSRSSSGNNLAMAKPRRDSGTALQGIALQSSSSPAGVNVPHTPQSGVSAWPKKHGNGRGRRANGTNPRAEKTNPRALKSKAISEAMKAKQYRDPVIPDSEQMSVEEMQEIRQRNIGGLPSEVADTLHEIAKSESEGKNGHKP